MKILKIGLSIFTAGVLLFLGEAFGAGLRPQEDEKVVFKEIGQFNDGGMAVTVLVVENRAYVCEFDNGLEILDVSDPKQIKKLGQLENTEEASALSTR